MDTQIAVKKQILIWNNSIFLPLRVRFTYSPVTILGILNIYEITITFIRYKIKKHFLKKGMTGKYFFTKIRN